MADPTLTDIMNKLNDLDDDIADVKQQCNEINPIKSKCDEIIVTLATDVIWQVCPHCVGAGYKMQSTFSGDPPVETIVNVTCPMCNGVKKIVWGEEKT